MSFAGIFGGILFGVGIGFAFGIIILSIKKYFEKKKLNKKFPEIQSMVNKNKKEVKDVKHAREKEIGEIEQRRRAGNLFKQSSTTGMGFNQERKPNLEGRSSDVERRTRESSNKDIAPGQRRNELSDVSDFKRDKFVLR